MLPIRLHQQALAHTVLAVDQDAVLLGRQRDGRGNHAAAGLGRDSVRAGDEVSLRGSLHVRKGLGPVGARRA